MGKVIQIASATRVVAGDSALTFIDECYARLAAAGGFIARDEQRQLSYDICKALVADEPLAAEAPTGTGKTIAYLIGAIAAAEKLRTVKDIPIVVATATVGLQGQVLTGDLPRLYKAGILPESDCALAKGRSRYFCVASAERLTAGKDGAPQFDFFNEEANTEVEVQEEVKVMLESWHGKAWAGDVDTYPGRPPAAWPQVAATAETCLGHKCEHYNSCAFFNARRALSAAKVIVANHDLVLADLAMAKEGVDPLFPGGRYLLVFDEAHHLPDKALDMGTGNLLVTQSMDELPKLAGFNKSWQRYGDLVKTFDKAKLGASDFDPSFTVSALAAVKDELSRLPYDEDDYNFRFPGGELPEGLKKALDLAFAHAQALRQAVVDATQAIKGSNLLDKNDALRPVIPELLYQLAFFGAQASSVVKALGLLVATKRAVRWACHYDGTYTLHSAPLEGAEVLRELLWSSERVAVAMVSATLQDFEGFDRFKDRVGVDGPMRTTALPHIFPYRESQLHLVTMRHSPKQDEKEDFLEELKESLPRFIDATEATLVLFPSRKLQEVVLPQLKLRFPGMVLCQGDKGIKELVKEHKDRIDQGRGNILCGLATLAEGLDLPGRYCTHVVICALPFTVPTSPVEQELQEVLGRHYFAKRALPDTLVKLVQMVGRLMRRESDRGRITVFDKRLVYTKWGLKMLNALPPFKRKLVAPDQPLLLGGAP